MGFTSIDATVRGPGGERRLTFLVDSGAAYTLLPHEVWREIGLASKRAEEFQLADGTVIERNVSECHISLDVGEGHTPVILGEEGDAALLGVITFEIFGLMLNPFTRRLQKMRLRLG